MLKEYYLRLLKNRIFKTKSAKAELAQTNKEAFDNAYKKSGNLIDAVKYAVR